MITETALMDIPSAPPEIQMAFDRPWNYIGYIQGHPREALVSCLKCIPLTKVQPIADILEAEIEYIEYPVVILERYQFITDDLIPVGVYFGRCDKCHRFYWGLQAPPYARMPFMQSSTKGNQ